LRDLTVSRGENARLSLRQQKDRKEGSRLGERRNGDFGSRKESVADRDSGSHPTSCKRREAIEIDWVRRPRTWIFATIRNL